jgi:hypothetical protein
MRDEHTRNRGGLTGLPGVVLLGTLTAAWAAPSALRAQERLRPPPARRELATPAGARAQATLGSVPPEVLEAALATWNAAATRRVVGDTTLAAGDTVRGALALRDGTLRLLGVVLGEVVVINGDVQLLEGAAVQGRLTVLGGRVTTGDRPAMAGEIRAWPARVRVEASGDSLVPLPEGLARWARWSREAAPAGVASATRASATLVRQLFVTTAHTYNRVEGLPLMAGPRVRLRRGDWAMATEWLGVFRTGDGLAWRAENLGHDARLSVRRGGQGGTGRGVSVDGAWFNVVAPVERWQLTEGEVGLATLLFGRDYRDYYGRHGGEGALTWHASARSGVRLALGQERWTTRRMRPVWALGGGDIDWRLNPAADEGRMTLLTLSGTMDTRTSAADPRSGWYVRAEVERGSGALGRRAPLTDVALAGANGPTRYVRAFVDARRYNRLAPGVQLNLRAAVGGWATGDPLPAQRRLTVSGLDALPGYDFRRLREGDAMDVGTCATGSDAGYALVGRPAQCERIALLQGELAGDFRVLLGGDPGALGDRRWVLERLRFDGRWVLFANAGRGWPLPPSGKLWEAPAFGTWRTDVGGGLDFGTVGVYVAQAVGEPGHAPNLYLRLGRRF